ncbi:hypothetical protein K439DRAFT_1610345 [Ramaria rubella]|nr:hypothetical protein K439DRAFT_1610345 [Ramaria rubella]
MDFLSLLNEFFEPNLGKKVVRRVVQRFVRRVVHRFVRLVVGSFVGSSDTAYGASEYRDECQSSSTYRVVVRQDLRNPWTTPRGPHRQAEVPLLLPARCSSPTAPQLPPASPARPHPSWTYPPAPAPTPPPLRLPHRPAPLPPPRNPLRRLPHAHAPLASLPPPPTPLPPPASTPPPCAYPAAPQRPAVSPTRPRRQTGPPEAAWFPHTADLAVCRGNDHTGGITRPCGSISRTRWRPHAPTASRVAAPTHRRYRRSCAATLRGAVPVTAALVAAAGPSDDQHTHVAHTVHAAAKVSGRPLVHSFAYTTTKLPP